MSDAVRSQEDAQWENLLRAAMEARPEAAWGGGDGADLAAAAIERSRLHHFRALRLQRIGRWVRMSSAAAALLLLIVLAVAVWWESRLGISSALNQTAIQSGTSANSTSELELAGASLLILVIAGILVRGVLSGERGPADLEKMVQMG